MRYERRNKSSIKPDIRTLLPVSLVNSDALGLFFSHISRKKILNHSSPKMIQTGSWAMRMPRGAISSPGGVADLLGAHQPRLDHNKAN
jgi:hypothetical protein